MNKISELINNLCPDGVKFIRLGDYIKVLRGKRLTTRDILENGKYPVYHGGNIPIGNYDKMNRNAYTTMIINVGASAGTVAYSDIDFWSSDGCFCLEQTNLFNNRFLYHLMLTYERLLKSKVRKAGIPTLDNKVIENLLLPVPPLEVQCEIVHILDDFTLLSAELSAELKARQKQYEYYKNLLLNTKGEIKKLGEVASFKTGSKPKNIFENKNSNYFEYINAGTTNSGYVDQTNSLKGAVTTPSRGQGGIGFVGYQAHDFWLGPLCYAIYSNDNSILNNKYIYYELSSKKDEILKRKNTGGVPSLNGCDLKTILINIPPIDEQLRIINILDKFEKICEDISEGLPAEIEARRKQYEYYRDRLLDFKELKVQE